MMRRLKGCAYLIKLDIHALYLARQDPRVPWYVKGLAIFVAGYAISPIDLIPDFIPVIGYLDDMILLPLGILLVVKLIPPEVMAEHRETAAVMQLRPVNRMAAIVIAVLWAALPAWCVWLVI